MILLLMILYGEMILVFRLRLLYIFLIIIRLALVWQQTLVLERSHIFLMGIRIGALNQGCR
jgi:hypothetical protein